MKIIGWGLGLALIILYIWEHTNLMNLGYQIERLQSEKRELYHYRQKLMAEVARLSSLDRIERLAMTQLGMVRPPKGRLIIVQRPASHLSVNSTPRQPCRECPPEPSKKSQRCI